MTDAAQDRIAEVDGAGVAAGGSRCSSRGASPAEVFDAVAMEVGRLVGVARTGRASTSEPRPAGPVLVEGRVWER